MKQLMKFLIRELKEDSNSYALFAQHDKEHGILTKDNNKFIVLWPEQSYTLCLMLRLNYLSEKSISSKCICLKDIEKDACLIPIKDLRPVTSDIELINYSVEALDNFYSADVFMMIYNSNERVLNDFYNTPNFQERQENRTRKAKGIPVSTVSHRYECCDKDKFNKDFETISDVGAIDYFSSFVENLKDNVENNSGYEVNVKLAKEQLKFFGHLQMICKKYLKLIKRVEDLEEVIPYKPSVIKKDEFKGFEKGKIYNPENGKVLISPHNTDFVSIRDTVVENNKVKFMRLMNGLSGNDLFKLGEKLGKLYSQNKDINCAEATIILDEAILKVKENNKKVPDLPKPDKLKESNV